MDAHCLPFSKISDNRLTRPVKRAAIRALAANGLLRTALNRYYRTLPDGAKAKFHERYSDVFRDGSQHLAAGTWPIEFAGQRIILPMRPEWSWLDWDAAVAVLGHDIEIKQTYASLILSRSVDVFLDVGANYGTHSILFLAAGIPIIAFEPNRTCDDYFHTVCKLNGLKGRRESVAVGSQCGEIELIYPEGQAWLGSTSGAVNRAGAIATRVPLRTLDSFMPDIPSGRILLKMDVEGGERDVLLGATNFIKQRRPIIIFESNESSSRDGLHQLLNLQEYKIRTLASDQVKLSQDEFRSHHSTNFMAHP